MREVHKDMRYTKNVQPSRERERERDRASCNNYQPIAINLHLKACAKNVNRFRVLRSGDANRVHQAHVGSVNPK